ncbi:MAG: acetoacetate--CoA ligase [Oligoflexales bacterium]|nr:acetoacetate--CoA ligase [Oligoflexales bacterium]
MADNPKYMWQADTDRIAHSNMSQFQKFLLSKGHPEFPTYKELHEWSIKDQEAFWSELSEFTKIKWRKKPTSTKTALHKDSFFRTTWFPNGTLNFAENILPKKSDETVLIAKAEGTTLRQFSATELRREVARVAWALKKSGLEKNDRVCAVVSNTPEALIAMLATTSLGAIWASCSPDFGMQAILDRFSQIEPKLMFCTLEYCYNGKQHSLIEILPQLMRDLPSVKTLVGIEHIGAAGQESKYLELTKQYFPWNHFKALAPISNEANPDDFLVFEAMPFNHPVYILFSSGTTGVPKCIIHSAGGTLLQHKKELLLHTDIKPRDRILYFTTCGWMMWNWMVSALSCEATLVLYDGSVTYPNLKVLWEFVAEQQVSCFGTSPKFLSLCAARGLKIKELFHFPKLKTLLSTGAPLLPEQFEYIYQSVKSDIHLASISGGTDIISCFMLGNPNLPVIAGQIQCLGLGMAVEAWDENGQVLPNDAQGELVCTKPFVSMPVGFWGDDENHTKYKKAYFDYFEHQSVWRHGDYISISKEGGVIVYGRSDTTLNPGGVRIGTAEIYRVVESLEEIDDSIVVGVPDLGDVSVVLFVKLKQQSSSEPFAKTSEKIAQKIKQLLSPRHMPKYIWSIDEIPYTRSHKKVELAVKETLLGKNIKNIDSLTNPGCLELYKNYQKYFSRS